MKPNDARQNIALVKRTKCFALCALVFCLIFIYFGLHLFMVESPSEWEKATITVAEVQQISSRINRWQIVDTTGKIYLAHETVAIISQVIPEEEYQIAYLPGRDNNIRAMIQGTTVIIDYNHSVLVHCERSVWDWLLAGFSLIGFLTTTFYMILYVRKNLPR